MLMMKNKEKIIIDKNCIYCRVGGTCNKCKLKNICDSYLKRIRETVV